MPLSAYHRWADPLTKGFEQAERFLRSEGFHHPKFLPYRTQLTPLARGSPHVLENVLAGAENPRTDWRDGFGLGYWVSSTGERSRHASPSTCSSSGSGSRTAPRPSPPPS